MALWKRGRRYWTYFSVNGVQLRRPLCPPGSRLATTNWQEAMRLEKEVIRAAMEGELAPRDPSVKLFAAIDDYLEAKEGDCELEARDRIRPRAAGDREAAPWRREALDHHAKGHRGISGQAAARGRQQPHDQHGRRRAAPGAQAVQAVAPARGRREDADRSRAARPSAARSRPKNRSVCSRRRPAIRSGSTSTAPPCSRRTHRCAASR